MVFKKSLILVLSAFVSAGIATAGGPDIEYAPQKKVTKHKVKKDVKPPKETEMVKEVPMAEIIPAQPCNPNMKRSDDKNDLKVAKVHKVNVLFESEPSNVEVLLNGLYVGTTPLQLPIVDGVHNIKMTIHGYTQWERQVKAYQGLRVYALLEKLKETTKASAQ